MVTQKTCIIVVMATREHSKQSYHFTIEHFSSFRYCLFVELEGPNCNAISTLSKQDLPIMHLSLGTPTPLTPETHGALDLKQKKLKKCPITWGPT